MMNKKIRRALGFVILAALLVSAVVIFSPVIAQAFNQVYLPITQNTGIFLDTFDGDPSSPQPFPSSSAWNVVVHSRDITTWDTLEMIHAEHGDDCSPAPATHAIEDYADMVFLCRNHLMTAINAGGYGVIYLTPNQMVDFSKGEAVIEFDLSTKRGSLRDWVDIWITPYEDNQELPLRDWLPDLNGEPRRAVVVAMDTFNGGTNFDLSVVRNFQAQDYMGNLGLLLEDYVEPSATRRDRFELRISRTHIKFGMPQYNLWWIDQDIPALDWSSGVVQFGHHSYNPKKDCTNCGPSTWHWDNVKILPAIPFTMIPAQQRAADENRGTQVTFDSPAPQDAYLRFAGIGNNLEVSFDGGRTWKKAVKQAQEMEDEGHFSSYWMPIPEGTKAVRFRGQPWWGGHWHVRDLSIWSRQIP